jgi:hypothetical protein
MQLRSKPWSIDTTQEGETYYIAESGITIGIRSQDTWNKAEVTHKENGLSQQSICVGCPCTAVDVNETANVCSVSERSGLLKDY